jgi:hypothetical protein
VVLVLHHALEILECAGEDHAHVGLEDRHVDQMVRLQEETGELDLLDVGGGILDLLLDQVFVALDVADLVYSGILGSLSDPARLQTCHGVASDGRGLGQDDSPGIGFPHQSNHRRHDLRARVDGAVGRALVAGVRLDDHRGAPLDQ